MIFFHAFTVAGSYFLDQVPGHPGVQETETSTTPALPRVVFVTHISI